MLPSKEAFARASVPAAKLSADAPVFVPSAFHDFCTDTSLGFSNTSNSDVSTEAEVESSHASET